MTIEETGVFLTRDGQRLHTRRWSASSQGQPDSSRSAVLILHGLGEHCGRYESLAQWFVARGFSVFSYDHFGHGRSDGARGDLPEARDYVDHACDLLAEVTDRMGQAPLLVGHSLGGAIAAALVILRRAAVRGLILSSPALAPGLKVPQKLLLAVMERLAPHLGVSNGVKSQFLSHDDKVIAAYRSDPLVHGKITARTVRWLLDTCQQLEESALPKDLPTLLLAALDDRLVNPQGSQRFAQRQAGPNLRFEPLAGFYHEIFNEDDARRQQVLGTLDLWLSQRIK